MKKTLALILAAMMVAGTASVAFADGEGHPEFTIDVDSNAEVVDVYVYDTDDNNYIPAGSTVEPGKKIGVKIKGTAIADDDKAVIKRYKAFADWKVGANLVESPEIEYKKVSLGNEYKKASSKPADKSISVDVTLQSETTARTVKIVVSDDLWTKTFSETILNESDKANLVDTVKALTVGAANGYDVYDVSGNKISTDAEYDAKAKEAIAKAIVNACYKDAGEKFQYQYFLTVKIKDSTTTKKNDLSGTVRVAKTVSDKVAMKGTINLTIGYGKKDDESGTITYEKATPVVDFDEDAGVVDIEFNDDALFTVDVTGQSALNLKYSTKFDADVAAKYPEANLEFIKWTATPTFNRTGDLYIYADEDTFIYEVTADGLKEISKAEYDEDYGAWAIRTRKLGAYAVSDVELDLAASSSSEASSSETSSSNPSTGGSTDTTNGNTNVKPNPNTGR